MITHIGLLDTLEGESKALPPEGLELVFVLTVETSLLNFKNITKFKKNMRKMGILKRIMFIKLLFVWIDKNQH